jgi:hypothetical protein
VGVLFLMTIRHDTARHGDIGSDRVCMGDIQCFVSSFSLLRVVRDLDYGLLDLIPGVTG